MYQIKHTNRKFLGIGLPKIITIILFLAGFVLFFSISNSAQSLVSASLSPFFKTGGFFYNSLGNVSRFFSDKNKLIAENTQLLSEIENLKFGLVDLEVLKYENQKVREGLEIKPIGDFISSFVIAKSPQIPLDSLILDKGFKDGINDGDFVLASERVLIGKVVKTSRSKSTVALNSFAGVTTFAFVSRTGELLEIKGAGGGSIEAKVSIDFDIKVGDKIMVADSLNYVVGIVGVVEEDTSSVFKDILMLLPADISKTNIVFIKPFINE